MNGNGNIKYREKRSICILIILGIVVYLALFATKASFVRFEIEKDPYKQPVFMKCPKFTSIKNSHDFPPPAENPQIDIHSYYPSPPPGVYYPPLLGNVSVVVQFDYFKGSWTGSPSIVKMENGDWIASLDVKVRSDMNNAKAWVTQIFVSQDKGVTWKSTATIKVQSDGIANMQKITWGSLFKVNGEVYLLGAADFNKKIRISKMKSYNKWTKPAVIVHQFQQIHTGNVGVLVTQDKVQTCIKNGRTNDVYVIYAHPEYDDLLKPWRISNQALDKLREYSSSLKEIMNIEFSLSEEAVMVPYGKSHAQIILRVNNEEICGLSERYVVMKGKFTMKLSIDPGWASAHGFVVYDYVSEYYWMISHYSRDTARDVTHSALYIPSMRTCQVDRSILGLYYNKHLTDSWHLAGFVSYSPDFAHHASYPFLVVDGDDLVFVARAHLGGPLNETTVNHGKRVCAVFTDALVTANNHNSNMVIFNRITNFRQYIHPMMWYGERMDNPWDATDSNKKV